MQFAHIARPRISLQGPQRVGGENEAGASDFCCISLQKFPRQKNNILAAFPKRQQPHSDNGDAKIKVLAKLAGFDQVFQVRVGCRHQAGINLDLLPAAHALQPLFLKKPQKLYLNRRREFADLVQEQGSAVCAFDHSPALHVRACKRALFMAEQFALQQIFGNRIAIDGHKRSLLTRTAPMDGGRRHFLAGAAFPQQEHRRVGRGHFADECKGRLHLRTGAEHLLEDFRSLSLLQLSIFLFQFYNVDASAKQQL